MKMMKNYFSRSERKKKNRGLRKEKGERNEKEKGGERKYSYLMNIE